MTIRELVYGLVANDAELNALGFLPENVFANGAPDSPPVQGRIFAVLNWGAENPALAGARGRFRPSTWDCALWVYNRDSDYGVINAAVKRWHELMDALEATRTGDDPHDGWVIATEWQSDGRDGWDDVYAANYRDSTYTITASGD